MSYDYFTNHIINIIYGVSLLLQLLKKMAKIKVGSQWISEVIGSKIFEK